jgi:hypothetical protein
MAAQIVIKDGFNAQGYTDENSLSRQLLTKPDTILPAVIFLAGKENLKFPLTFLTEGQKGGTMKPLEISDIEFDWPVMGALRQTDTIKSHNYQAGDTPGRGFTPITVTMESEWFKYQHTVVTPSGQQLRIQRRPTPSLSGGYTYTFKLLTINASDSLPLSDLVFGTAWAMEGGATVSSAFSEGNESNTQTPGKLKNQISVLRKSYHVGGNVGQRTVEVSWDIPGGKRTNLWMDFEEWQHTMNWIQACEEHLWYSKYNRTASGQILLMDEHTNQPIPHTAGVLDQIPNRDTFGKLTATKIKNVVSEVMQGAMDTDMGNVEIVLYCGKGFQEEFDTAMKDELKGWTTVDSKSFMTGAAGTHNLAYGSYFTAYRHTDGHMITLKNLPILDYGARADVAPKHPVSGRPITSHNAYFLDQSTYGGMKNIRMVSQKGRSLIRGIEQGMAIVKGNNFADYKGNYLNLSTGDDKSSIHFMSTKGVAILRNTSCFALECDINQL